AVQLESPGGWPLKDEREQDDCGAGLGFLAGEIREQVGRMILSSRRIPEEALSFTAMSRLLRAEC
ncbi:MAG: hypothetical protein ACYC6M_15755, partial [Terriglobales bacterium]